MHYNNVISFAPIWQAIEWLSPVVTVLLHTGGSISWHFHMYWHCMSYFSCHRKSNRLRFLFASTHTNCIYYVPLRCRYLAYCQWFNTSDILIDSFHILCVDFPFIVRALFFSPSFLFSQGFHGIYKLPILVTTKKKISFPNYPSISLMMW